MYYWHNSVYCVLQLSAVCEQTLLHRLAVTRQDLWQNFFGPEGGIIHISFFLNIILPMCMVPATAPVDSHISYVEQQTSGCSYGPSCYGRYQLKQIGYRRAVISYKNIRKMNMMLTDRIGLHYLKTGQMPPALIVQ